MRLFCRKCDKEIPEYKIEIIKQDNGLYMHMITVECHGKGWLRCFEDRHGPEFNTFVYENVYFFEKEESHTNWAAFKECADILKRANIRNELGNCAEMIDREYNRVVAENEELKNTERKAVKKTVDLHLKCMALEEHIDKMETIRQPLVWTKSKPTKPGWYWYRKPSNFFSIPVYFFGDNKISVPILHGGAYCLSGITDIGISMGEWAGPISKPEENRSCCEQWVAKTFRRYLEFKDCKVPHIDNRFTFCPECGEKL